MVSNSLSASSMNNGVVLDDWGSIASTRRLMYASRRRTDSIAAIKSRSASDFKTKPNAPPCITACNNCAEKWQVRMTNSIPGRLCLISAAASNPLKPGMLKSNIATSGRNRFAIATASSPLSASAQISHPSRAPNIALSPDLTTA